jgi:hypothetical protein
VDKDMVNKRALAIVERIRSKLKGILDEDDKSVEKEAQTEGVTEQVDRLIGEATSHENLVSMYAGGCAFGCGTRVEEERHARTVCRFWSYAKLDFSIYKIAALPCGQHCSLARAAALDPHGCVNASIPSFGMSCGFK